MSERTQPPAQAVAQLPVLKTVLAAVMAAFGRPGLLLQAALGGLILLAFSTLIYLVLPNALTATLMIFVPLAAYCHFGVNWYRIMLLGPQGLVRPILRWDRRHWRFFAFGIGLGAGLLFLDLLLSKALPLPFAGPLIAIGLLYLAARCSFLFPTIAVEEPYSLAFSWRHTQGQGLRLTAALLVAGLPLLLILAILVNLLFFAATGISIFELAALQVELQNGASQEDIVAALDERMAEASPAALLSVNLIASALCMAALAVLYSIVAIAFLTCTGWVPASPGNPPAPLDGGPDDQAGDAER